MTFNDINNLGKKKIPFLFISDFKAEKIEVFLLKDLEKENIKYQIDLNYKNIPHAHSLKKYPESLEKYENKFDYVLERIKEGETYLLNLTNATKVETPLSLDEIYSHANASYKLKFKEKFVCFSPERFIYIKDNKIHTYPMKGTIDASIENAKEVILSNEKEMAEHVMVVDLLRNDLSIVSKNVQVESFRYITEIEAGSKKLLQVSSHISGDLESDWHENLGNILKSLLPAGSISGAPKKSTLEIIDKVESYKRDDFTGIFGVYDGENFDSGVMIRFIEKTDNGYIYKSGGGITLESTMEEEYQELLDKVYIP